MNLEGMDICQAKTIRGATKIPTELRYRIEVRLLRRRRQIADRHVLDHAAAKRADLSHRKTSCLKGWASKNPRSSQTGGNYCDRPLTAAPAASFNPECRLDLDFTDRWWHERALPQLRWPVDENVLPALLYLVARGDLRHAADDLALRRVRGRGRIRQPLLPHPRRPDRSGPRLRAALGAVQWPRRGFEHSASVARLDASHRRCAAHAGNGRAASVVEAASSQPHRHAGSASSHRLHARPGPQAQGDRRLQGVVPWPLMRELSRTAEAVLAVELSGPSIYQERCLRASSHL